MLAKRPVKNIHIYILKDPETGEIRYVGKTKASLEERLKGHLNGSTTNHRGCWIKALKTKNLKPIIESIERVSDEMWAEREMFWIQHYKELGVRLVNGNDGGLGGHNPSAETRAKLSAANKNRSAETRAKMSAAKRNMSAETRAKIATASAGRKHSEENRFKMSAANLGKKHTAESRAKMSALAKARHQAKLAAKNIV